MLAIAVLTALEHRRRTGRGQRVELALSEAAAFLLGHLYLHRPCTGRALSQDGNASPVACPHGVYRGRGGDRWIAIAVGDDGAWQRFRARLGWADEPRWATRAGRLACRDEIDARVSAWTVLHTPEDAATRLQAIGVSAFPVQGPTEHRSDPHLAARGAFVSLDDPEVGAVLHVADPLRHSTIPLVAPAPAPRLGADTERVLVDVLGMSPGEAARLVVDGTCV
jgi:crotonobetainyl-CoA:carnitine CoA-transferase CaiB-like acyl-CoA transferase